MSQVDTELPVETAQVRNRLLCFPSSGSLREEASVTLLEWLRTWTLIGASGHEDLAVVELRRRFADFVKRAAPYAAVQLGIAVGYLLIAR